jgi:hypothetical protein
MKMKNLFNLVEDADAIANVFAKVDTTEQMVSLLERLKKQGATELLEYVQSMRLSLQAAMEDTLEIGGSIGGDVEDDNFMDDESSEDEDLLEGLAEEDEIPPAKTEEPEKKS